MAHSFAIWGAYFFETFCDTFILPKTSDSFLVDAGADDYCFVENASVAEFKEKIAKLVIYKWNRDYPADFYFDIDYANDYKLETTLDFIGTSHEKITKEVYVR